MFYHNGRKCFVFSVFQVWLINLRYRPYNAHDNGLAIHLASKPGEDSDPASDATPQNVERLVRLPLEELQQSNTQQ